MKRCLQRGLRGLYREPEGWLALPTGYDDGGVSGATLERPALQPRNRQHDCPRSKVLIRDNARLSEIREMPTWVLQRAPANRGGYAELVAWARTLGAVETFGDRGHRVVRCRVGEFRSPPRRPGRRSQSLRPAKATEQREE